MMAGRARVPALPPPRSPTAYLVAGVYLLASQRGPGLGSMLDHRCGAISP